MTKWRGIAVLLAMVGCVAMLGCGDGGGSVKVPDTPDGTVKAVAEGLAAGKPQILWAAMPASYQKDVDGLVKDFAANMDAELYDKGWALAGKLVSVLKKQKAFIVASPMMAQAKLDPKKVEAKLDSTVALLDAITSSELSTIAKLKTLDIGKFLAGTGGKVMAAAKELSELTPGDEYNKEFIAGLKGLKVEVVETAADSATLNITPGGESAKKEKFVKVEGKWVPEEMATDWKEAMAEAKKSLASMTKEGMAEAKPMVMGVMAAVDTTLDQLLAADSQAKFDEAAGTAMMSIMGAMMGGGGPKPGPMPPAPPTPTPPAPPTNE